MSWCDLHDVYIDMCNKVEPYIDLQNSTLFELSLAHSHNAIFFLIFSSLTSLLWLLYGWIYKIISFWVVWFWPKVICMRKEDVTHLWRQPNCTYHLVVYIVHIKTSFWCRWTQINFVPNTWTIALLHMWSKNPWFFGYALEPLKVKVDVFVVFLSQNSPLSDNTNTHIYIIIIWFWTCGQQKLCEQS